MVEAQPPVGARGEQDGHLRRGVEAHGLDLALGGGGQVRVAQPLDGERAVRDDPRPARREHGLGAREQAVQPATVPALLPRLLRVCVFVVCCAGGGPPARGGGAHAFAGVRRPLRHRVDFLKLTAEPPLVLAAVDGVFVGIFAQLAPPLVRGQRYLDFVVLHRSGAKGWMYV